MVRIRRNYTILGNRESSADIPCQSPLLSRTWDNLLRGEEFTPYTTPEESFIELLAAHKGYWTVLRA
jgi:hypothetical protein